MFINIHIYSKNYLSITRIVTFFSNTFLLKKLNVTIFTSIYQNPTKYKTFTVLKSPHINKTAQEHFDYCIYKKTLKIHSYKGFLVLTLLKLLKYKIFADVKFKISIANQPFKFEQNLQNKINPNNFILIQNSSGLKTYLKVFDNYGKFIIKSKICLDSSVG